MKQKPWDRYEAALLLSYCLKIEAGDIPRKEAVDIVSNTLRKRAEVQGVEIDETFRNTNGISMQMSAIRNCYLGKDHGLAGSKLFHEMVDLYKSNHDALEQILQGESDKVNRSIWQEFLLWLKEAVPDKEKEIVTSLAAVSMLALKSNRTHMPISEISDVAEIERLQSIMRKPGALGLHSKKMLTKASHALNTYVQFLDKKADDAAAPEESQSVSVEESVVHANFRVDFSKSISYAHTKPISCKYKGRDISCAGWNALFINLTRLIYQECGDTFPVGCSLLSSSRIDIGNAEGMNYPKEIANGVYLECNASATGIVNKLHALFDICGINYDDVIIEYCKTSDNIVSEKEVKASNPQVAALEKLLSKHYKYGFRLGSPIELMRIRNFAEEDGIFLADSDEELERKIAATGIKIDGKVFIIESEILSEIAAVTDSVFDEGATVIFLNQLMEIKEEWLSEQHITNVDMLKTLLKRIRPNYYYGQNIITPGEKSTEHDAIVKEILRISTGQSVVRTDALKEKLPYIPTEKIAWSLSTSPEFIWISEGKYFLMNQFVLSEEDANTISEHVANECELNGYASITDLPLGNIQEENYELSETAIYAAVYSTVLKEHYYLHGKILTKEENGVDISALLKAYCAGKSCCTASELMERAEELTGTPNKQTSMAILYDSMIRVDVDEFVSEDQIHFDTNAVDTLLKSMVGTRFAPIRSVNTFALFPSCGASWNHYILESFCYRFSEGYRLAVINYNDKNAGLIVSKNLTLSYADMLSEAAANSSMELTLESVGQYFFDNGYTANTESDNWAIKGLIEPNDKHQTITSQIEHHAVLNACSALERLGYPVVYLPVDSQGVVLSDSLSKAITEKTKLVSVMMVNNEIGTIEPIKELATIAHTHNVLFHTDAVQAVGHIPIDVNELGIDMLSSSAHKFNGPKGIGFLYIRKGTQIRPLADGGAQEFHMRAGTENIASIVGMAVALKKNCRTMQETSTKLQAMDHAFIDVLHEANVDFIRNGSVSKSPGIISVSIRNISGEMLLHRLDLKGISISTGSACDSVNTQVSHVIKAIGVPSAYAQGTIRISFGHDNQIEDAVEIAHAIAKILQT